MSSEGNKLTSLYENFFDTCSASVPGICMCSVNNNKERCDAELGLFTSSTPLQRHINTRFMHSSSTEWHILPSPLLTRGSVFICKGWGGGGRREWRGGSRAELNKIARERKRLQPSVRLAGIQTTAHRAQAHASLPLSAIVSQRRRTQTGPRNNTPKKHTHTPIAEHKRALVMVNRARNVISAGIKLVRDKGI